MALYRSLSIYLSIGPKAKAGVEALEMAGVGIEVPLPLMWALVASSFLPVRGGGLQQVYKLAI